MANLSKSILRDVGAGKKPRAFSSFDDLLNALIENGVVSSKEELIEKQPEQLSALLFEWYIQGQIACVFAQMLAGSRKEDWQSIVFKEPVEAEELEERLVQSADNLEALQLIFVGDGTPEQAVELIRMLCQHSSWSCHEMPWMKNEHADSIPVGLRWHRPDSNYVSWVLGIAPFEPMPFTRRFVEAPFIALVFRPSPPDHDRAPKRVEGGLEASHLAHMNDGLGSDEEKRARTKAKTIYHKQTLLGDELRSHARAMVTFAFPGHCRESLASILTPLPQDDANE
jgi:hypothetical protein